MRYHLFQNFFGKMVKMKETSFLLSMCLVSIARHCRKNDRSATRKQISIKENHLWLTKKCSSQTVFKNKICFQHFKVQKSRLSKVKQAFLSLTQVKSYSFYRCTIGLVYESRFLSISKKYKGLQVCLSSLSLGNLTLGTIHKPRHLNFRVF